MFLLPFERLTFESPFPPDMLYQRLADVIEPPRAMRFFSRNHKPYQGHYDRERFQATRIIHYRNSFLPVVKGEIRPALGGSAITLTLRPHAFAIVFMLIWFGFAGSIFALALSGVLNKVWQLGDWMALTELALPSFFLAFGYALVMIGFKIESRKARTFFRELFRV